MDKSTETSFWRRVTIGEPDDCWPWQGRPTPNGYGQVTYQQRHYVAHVLAYVLTYGARPEGYDLDHVCHTRDTQCLGGVACPHRVCCNPAHLEPVSHGENLRRGRTQTARNAAVTHCPMGHEYTPENTFVSKKGSRTCRACMVRWRASPEKKRAEARSYYWRNRDAINQRAKERRAHVNRPSDSTRLITSQPSSSSQTT